MNDPDFRSLLESDDEPVVGHDGELIEPDKSVDPLVYQRDYVSRFRLRLPRGYWNEWDDSRRLPAILVGCPILLVMGLMLISMLAAFLSNILQPMPGQ